MAKNPGIAGALLAAAGPALAEERCQPSTAAPHQEKEHHQAKLWYLNKKKAVSSVPVPQCHGITQARWHRFIRESHVDAELSERLRDAIFEAAKYLHREGQLAWSPETLRRLREVKASADGMITRQERRLAAGILASQLPCLSLMTHGTSHLEQNAMLNGTMEHQQICSQF